MKQSNGWGNFAAVSVKSKAKETERIRSSVEKAKPSKPLTRNESKPVLSLEDSKIKVISVSPSRDEEVAPVA
jgi:hypothetical protein